MVVCQIGCNDGDPGMSTQASQPLPDAGSCTIDSSCLDIDVEPLTTAACCTAKSSCGYILPEIDDETLLYYPDAQAMLALAAKDDPNGRCAPESFIFGPLAGMAEERCEDEGVPDILVATTCSSYHIWAFTLAGCCLPDDSCGISTRGSDTTLGALAQDENAPFARPECVPAAVLNQQFRDSSLRSLARVTGGGTCNYAEIDARQPNYF
jgi:hypothetical protein